MIDLPRGTGIINLITHVSKTSLQSMKSKSFPQLKHIVKAKCGCVSNTHPRRSVHNHLASDKNDHITLEPLRMHASSVGQLSFPVIPELQPLL